MTDTHTAEHRPTTPAGKRERALDAATDAARRTAAGLESNPLGLLVGGLAVGVIAGALIPRSAKEKELLAPVGKRLGDGARAAIDTAREQGRSELESRGFTKDAAQEQVKNLLGGVSKALSSAGSVAAKSVTGKAEQTPGGATNDGGF
ncbi:MAG: hypothetical protein JWN21_1915 [Sphingomonas bacterium]|uniref:hypothetical protein n=1 Tax=Sphingomonas bacterium TaxID=1895847 RepID=UPI00263358BC|nr:hypothetical protein [Sphingomonas bacterium]MDB5696372.1 hypothetical protein [Sphingomonas bacterium]